MHPYILLRNKIIDIPENTSEANSSHSSLFLGQKNMKKGKFTNFQNSYKTNKNSYYEIFWKEIYIGKKNGRIALL